MLHARKSYNERVQDSAGKIPMDEPVFLLRGQDKLAPVMLDIYVAMTESEPGRDGELMLAVKEHANRMRRWQSKRAVKVADMEPDDRHLGMYAETPLIQIGNITIRENQSPADECVWMEDNGVNGGKDMDAGAFLKSKLEPLLKEFYDRNF